MPSRWLPLFFLGVTAVVVLLFFSWRLQPFRIKTDASTEKTTAIVGSLVQPSITFLNPKKGAKNPTTSLVIFSDFLCDACKTLSATLDQMVARDSSLQIVWKDMPNETAHPLATKAAMAAQCAADQGSFWTYHDVLYAQQESLQDADFVSLASALNLNPKIFETCLDTQESLPRIRKDYEEGLALGIKATPTFFIGTKRWEGAFSEEELQTIIHDVQTGK